MTRGSLIIAIMGLFLAPVLVLAQSVPCTSGLCPISKQAPPNPNFPEEVQSTLNQIFGNSGVPSDMQNILTGTNAGPIFITDVPPPRPSGSDSFRRDRATGKWGIYWPSKAVVPLAHELFHVYQQRKGTYNPKPGTANRCENELTDFFNIMFEWIMLQTGESGLPISEIEAVRFENRFRACNREAPRTCYGGKVGGGYKIPDPLLPPPGWTTCGDCVLDPGEECDPKSPYSQQCANGSCQNNCTCPPLQVAVPCNMLAAPACGGGNCPSGTQCRLNDANKCECTSSCGDTLDLQCTGFCPGGMVCDGNTCACNPTCVGLPSTDCALGACAKGGECRNSSGTCVCLHCEDSAASVAETSSVETLIAGASVATETCTLCGNGALDEGEECDGSLGTCLGSCGSAASAYPCQCSESFSGDVALTYFTHSEAVPYAGCDYTCVWDSSVYGTIRADLSSGAGQGSVRLYYLFVPVSPPSSCAVCYQVNRTETFTLPLSRIGTTLSGNYQGVWESTWGDGSGGFISHYSPMLVDITGEISGSGAASVVQGNLNWAVTGPAYGSAVAPYTMTPDSSAPAAASSSSGLTSSETAGADFFGAAR